ncbi:MAG: hypothetical protein ACQESP_09065 [Candidatus Muiribacteriota bacterium]
MKEFLQKFGKLFLILFIIDGILSVTDDINGLIYGQSFISSLRQDISFLVFANSFFLYFFCGIFNLLPHKIFIPVTLYGLLVPFISGYFTINYYTHPDAQFGRISNFDHHLAANNFITYGIIILIFSIIQTAIGVWAWNLYHNKKYELSEDFFVLKKFLLFGGLNVILLFFLVPFLILTNLVYTVNELTNGFIKSDYSNLYSIQKDYEKDNTKISLIGMVHIGQAEFYQDLLQNLPDDKEILLLQEGVTDEEELLEIKPNYEGFSKALGVDTQAENFRLDPDKYDIINLDKDVSEFSETSIYLINQILDVLENSSTIREFYQNSRRFESMAQDPETLSSFYDDILHGRNELILDEMEEYIEDYDYIIIPWGAYHLDEIESYLYNNGFRTVSRNRRKVIQYSNIIANIFN